MKLIPKKLKEYWERKKTKYSRIISPTAFGAGFVLDLFTLNRIDQKFDLTILLIHISLVTFWILLWHIARSPHDFFIKHEKAMNLAHKIAPTAMQFSFGALFSGFVIFYTKSSSILISWPFLIIIYTLFLGNETFRKFYRGLYFQMGLFFFSLFTFLIFFVPLQLHRIGLGPFLISGLISIILIGGFLYFCKKILQSISKKEFKIVCVSVLGIWVSMNVLYVYNFIPAIPLSLKTDGIYESIIRTPLGGYSARKEERKWWEYLNPVEKIQKIPKQDIYYFSSVFAPIHFKEPIVHDWQRWDPYTRSWRSIYDHTINIIGGRDGGFRGYTYLIDPVHGTWRILVRTPKGQILGQKKFHIIPQEEYRADIYKEL